MGVAVALVLDFNNPYLKAYAGGQRFMIFMFQTVNTRFGGEIQSGWRSTSISARFRLRLDQYQRTCRGHVAHLHHAHGYQATDGKCAAERRQRFTARAHLSAVHDQ